MLTSTKKFKLSPVSGSVNIFEDAGEAVLDVWDGPAEEIVGERGGGD